MVPQAASIEAKELSIFNVFFKRGSSSALAVLATIHNSDRQGAMKCIRAVVPLRCTRKGKGKRKKKRQRRRRGRGRDEKEQE